MKNSMLLFGNKEKRKHTFMCMVGWLVSRKAWQIH